MGYQVTSPLVQARKQDGAYVHVYEGGFLPDDADPEQLEQLLAGGMVAESDTSEDGSGSKSRRSRSASSDE